MSKPLTYVEIDLSRCQNAYGIAPCTASIPSTGVRKCFNSTGTCQDRVNFDSSVHTVRFGKGGSQYPIDIPHLACLVSVQSTGQTISLGENIGMRATITCKFRMMLHNDVGFDKYLDERSYDPMKQGDFWGRFRAREPFIQGQPLRVIRGYVGQTFEQMVKRHYVIESFSGPDADGYFTIIARDILKLADGDKAQAPLLSNGFLLNQIDASQTNATLTPTGIGNLEYPESGHINIGGKEICSFTRSNNNLTLVRGRLNTTAVAHDAEERCQIVLSVTSQSPADIINMLITDYTEMPGSIIPIEQWQLECNTYLQRLYSAHIAEPTGVDKLISELVEQAALAIWWDDITQLLRLQVLRGVPSDAGVYDMNLIKKGSLQVNEQPNKRISQVWTYYALLNPLLSIDDPKNYLSSALRIAEDADVAYQLPAIKKIFSRWIPPGARTTAIRVNDIQMGRYVKPPRKLNWDLFGESATTSLGQGYKAKAWNFQNDDGSAAEVPVQITNVSPSEEGLSVEAQEILFTNFDPSDLTDRTIIIESPEKSINLRSKHDNIYPPPTDADVGNITVTFIVAENVLVGSNSTSIAAITSGSWPSGMIPLLIIQEGAKVYGHGGKGGDGRGGNTNSNEAGFPGEKGGAAVQMTVPFEIDNYGEIGGGGGGGGGGPRRHIDGPGSLFWVRPGSGGGGGQGYDGGEGGLGASNNDGSSGPGFAGTPSAPGEAGVPNAGVGSVSLRGGDGGPIGQPGQASAFSPSMPGAAGEAIIGDSLIMWNNEGTIIGPRVG